MLAAQQLHYLVEKARAQLMALIGARNVAHDHIYTQSCGLHPNGCYPIERKARAAL